jgi:anaphase-promoting complex subunit 3
MDRSGPVPEIDQLFPPRPPPVKRMPPEDHKHKPAGPIVTGAGFFTPDMGNAGNLFRSWKQDGMQPQRARTGQIVGVRDLKYVCSLTFVGCFD